LLDMLPDRLAFDFDHNGSPPRVPGGKRSHHHTSKWTVTSRDTPAVPALMFAPSWRWLFLKR